MASLSCKEHPALHRILVATVNFVVPLSTPVVIAVTMTIMYRTVYEVGRKCKSMALQLSPQE